MAVVVATGITADGSREILVATSATHSGLVAALRRSFQGAGPQRCRVHWDEVRDQLATRFPKIGPCMDGAKTEVFAFTAFPHAPWQKIWSTNPLERISEGSVALLYHECDTDLVAELNSGD